ncbi:MAG: T9SS type A sorting domain-containing protein [candidate division Zixibacteria bacterium]|nr:T9SS type A sorting domain-containing protein [candidate division Zixibacteria bacterium]
MKMKLFIILASLTLCSFGLAYGQSISLDRVDGQIGETDSISTGETITFYIRMTNGDIAMGGVTNGFRVYSPDGAVWDTTIADTIGTLGKTQFEGGFFINTFSLTGSGADTVGFGGFILSGTGMLPGFDTVAYTIDVGPINASYEGKTICLDSCYYPPQGYWMWSTHEPAPVYPTWDGPHCYTISTTGSDVKSVPGDNRPTRFALGQNYPNPFNPRTEIRFDIAKRSHVTLSIYNVLGQEVTTLINEMLPCDHYVVDWDGTSGSGKSVASGVYFYRIEAEDFIETKKMMLLK